MSHIDDYFTTLLMTTSRKYSTLLGMHQFQFEPIPIPILGLELVGIGWNRSELESESVGIGWNWHWNWLELIQIRRNYYRIGLQLVSIGKIIMDSVWNWSQKNTN
jgi:hypothetical protein